ncbi:DUF3969 family protein [Massilibacterium senegalense]|uniref:DUF3969 family protein n=1 Tax=Massilibacterium senegalense TaxID=1632858 RepID=UPI000785FBB8|nr:DUF3969 family protein [Massilibacterium senegalense]
MKFEIAFEPGDMEKIIGIYAVGLLNSLENGSITLKEAEELLFHPKMAIQLKKAEASDEIVDLICHGCELEELEQIEYAQFVKQVKKLKQETLQLLQKQKRQLYKVSHYLKI